MKASLLLPLLLLLVATASWGDNSEHLAHKSRIASATTYYEVIGVASDADEAAIRKAIKKLSLKFHPDLYQSDDQPAIWTIVQMASSMLRASNSRQLYDGSLVNKNFALDAQAEIWNKAQFIARASDREMSEIDLLLAIRDWEHLQNTASSNRQKKAADYQRQQDEWRQERARREADSLKKAKEVEAARQAEELQRAQQAARERARQAQTAQIQPDKTRRFLERGCQFRSLARGSAAVVAAGAIVFIASRQSSIDVSIPTLPMRARNLYQSENPRQDVVEQPEGSVDIADASSSPERNERPTGDSHDSRPAPVTIPSVTPLPDSSTTSPEKKGEAPKPSKKTPEAMAKERGKRFQPK